MKLYSDDIPTALEKYSTTHKREIDGAGVMQTFHLLSYIIFTTYLYTLGGSPCLRMRFIVQFEYSFEDVCYFYQTSYNYSKKVAISLALGFVFAFLISGWLALIKLSLTLLICFLLLNIFSLMKEDVKEYRDECMIIRVITAFTLILVLLSLLAVYLIG